MTADTILAGVILVAVILYFIVNRIAVQSMMKAIESDVIAKGYANIGIQRIGGGPRKSAFHVVYSDADGNEVSKTCTVSGGKAIEWHKKL